MHRFAGLRIFLLATMLLTGGRSLDAQPVGRPSGGGPSGGSPVQMDTVAASNTFAASDTGAFHMTKSPLEAVLLSTLLPGAGQVYLDQFWKIPILYGLIGGFFYGEQIQNARYHYTQDTITNAFARGNAQDSGWAQQNIPVREFYRDDRDKWWIYLAITYLANVLDAYIAANLYDFDVSNPTTSVGSFYDPWDRQVGMSLTLRLK